ncbi:hypothetical protein [Pseudomonas sp. LB3P14]
MTTISIARHQCAQLFKSGWLFTQSLEPPSTRSIPPVILRAAPLAQKSNRVTDVGRAGDASRVLAH